MIARAPSSSRAAACAAALLLSCATSSSEPRPAQLQPAPPARPEADASPNPFVHAVGPDLVDGDGRKIVPRGFAFSHLVYLSSHLPEGMHGEEDYRRCRELGADSIRFYMHYRWFEDDRKPYVYDERAFAWLAQQLAWARGSGIRLLLNLHIPPGGFQSNGGGRALWTDPENRRRFVALWREIARRFRDDPAVLGYDLLNEPVVTKGISQWEELARATVAAIREVDQRHLIAVERLNAVVPGGWFRRPRLTDWNPNRNGEWNFVLIDDPNILYEFHFYQPIQFTHQGASWLFPFTAGSGSYPGRFLDWDGKRKLFDRAYVEEVFREAVSFRERHQAPVYLGEFGVIHQGLEEGRHGDRWIGDVLDVALGHGIGVSYHSWDDEPFGIYGPAGFDWTLARLLQSRYRDPVKVEP